MMDFERNNIMRRFNQESDSQKELLEDLLLEQQEQK